MDTQIYYVTKPDVNPLSFRERRTPMMPLFRMSQMIGLIGITIFLIMLHGWSFGGIRTVAVQLIIFATPVLWLFNVENGSIRIERYVRSGIFFMRLIMQRPRRNDDNEVVEAMAVQERQKIAWYEVDRTVYF